MGVGCTRRDWVSDVLVLTDVTGTWEATDTAMGVPSRTFLMTLRQSGTRVTGDTSAVGVPSVRSDLEGSLEGVVNGDGLHLHPEFRSASRGHPDGEDMSGGIAGPPVNAFLGCPCPITLRRQGSAAPSQRMQ